MRLACIDIPALPLQLLLQRHPDWREHPAAVVDRDASQGVLQVVNRQARQRGILPGMRYAAALSLTHELRAGVIAEAEIREATARLQRLLDFYAPGIETAEEAGVFWLDASGLSLLYPSLLQWAREIRSELARHHWRSSIAVGFSRLRCYALAKAAQPPELVVHTPQEEEQRARAVPLARLNFEPKLRDALARLGIRDLGAFVDLPGDGVRKRFGVDVHRIHQLARDELWSPVQAQPLPEPLRCARVLDQAESDVERLLQVAAELLELLLAKLRERSQLLRCLQLELQLEDDSAQEHVLTPAQATLDAAILLQLLRLRLTSLVLARPVERLVLHAQGVAARRDQLELFPATPGRDLDAAARAFARLRAEFGDDAVQCATLLDGHLPMARYRLSPLHTLPPAQVRAQTVDLPERRPLVRRIADKPIALSRQRRQEPDGWMIAGLDGGAVEEVHGPYLVSGGWWRREQTREYHYVRTPKAGWLWVYFDRERKRWFLQGTIE